VTTFSDALGGIPYNPTTTNGSGLLPVYLRTLNHLVFLLSSLAGENIIITDEEALRELLDAKTHWGERSGLPPISTTASETLDAFGGLLDAAYAEYTSWPDIETKTTNVRDLVNRASALGAVLDREFIGIRQSDPGYSL